VTLEPDAGLRGTGTRNGTMPFVRCHDVRLYYELHGPEEAPVLVLNNGILMNAAGSWVPQTRAFSARYRVLQYDCRGQGQSDHPDCSYSMRLHADDLAALLDALRIPRAHILGLSYGGEVAQAFALAYPALTSSLILADTVSEVGPELAMIAEGWRVAALTGNHDLVFLVSAPWNFSAQFIREKAGLLEIGRQRHKDLDLPAVARLADAFAGVDFTARLGEITVPTCIVVGEADLIKGPRYANILHQGIRGSELHTIPGAGHATSWEAPALFNEIVLGFLDRVVNRQA
jgi:3-oxoadipate enol-lactonase